MAEPNEADRRRPVAQTPGDGWARRSPPGAPGSPGAASYAWHPTCAAVPGQPGHVATTGVRASRIYSLSTEPQRAAVSSRCGKSRVRTAGGWAAGVTGCVHGLRAPESQEKRTVLCWVGPGQAPSAGSALPRAEAASSSAPNAEVLGHVDTALGRGGQDRSQGRPHRDSSRDDSGAHAPLALSTSSAGCGPSGLREAGQSLWELQDAGLCLGPAVVSSGRLRQCGSKKHLPACGPRWALGFLWAEAGVGLGN